MLSRYRLLLKSVLAGLTMVPSFVAAAPTADGSGIMFLSADQQLKVYKAVGSYYTTHLVPRGKTIRPLPYAAKRVFPAVIWQGKTYTNAADLMTASRMSGLIVVKHGKVVFEGYALGRKSTDRWISFSVAKSFTSTLIGAAIKDGAITSLDDPVEKYVPQIKGGGYEGVKIRDLLKMSSGIKWNENYDDPNSDANLIRGWTGEPGMNTLVSYLRRLPREVAPGTRFHYATGDTDLAGVVLRNATQKTLSAYLSEKIWQPLGMERDATWLIDKDGQEKGGSSLSITLRDYARFGIFILGGAKINGKSIVPDWYLKEATSNQIGSGHPEGYGYFWWMDPDGFSAKGVHGQLIRVDPKRDMVMVVNSAWWPSATDPIGIKAWDATFDAFAKALD